MKFKKYEKIYPFAVEEAVKAGVDVRVIDKADYDNPVRRISLTTYAVALALIDDKTGRYEFYAGEDFTGVIEPAEAVE